MYYWTCATLCTAGPSRILTCTSCAPIGFAETTKVSAAGLWLGMGPERQKEEDNGECTKEHVCWV